MPAYVIGIDAGGTKSRACAFDLEGNLWSHHVTGQGNFLTDPKESWNHVVSAADACVKDMGKNPAYVFLGAAGIYGSGLEGPLEEKLKARYGCPGKVADDGTLALYGNLKGKDGILVIAGTGSVVYGKCGSTVLRNGGWGQFLDDRGSGYDIAMVTLKELVRGYDAGRKLSSMEKELLRQAECSSVLMLPEFLKKASKGEVGALARIVSSYGEMGDQSAARILKDAGCRLADMAISVADRLDLPAPAVAVSGSILKKCRPVYEAFWNTWREKRPDFEAAETEDMVEKAALWFYRANSVSGA